MKRFVLPLVVFTVALSFMVFMNMRHVKIRFQSDAEVFKSVVEIICNSISASYFQWTVMYEAVLKGEDFEKLISDMNVTFPVIERVWLQKSENETFEIYKIFSESGELFVKFKIYNDDLSASIENKFVLIQIDVYKLLNLLNMEHIVITPHGSPFAFGLRAKVSKPPIDGFSLFVSVLAALTSWMYSNLKEQKYKLLNELAHKEELQRRSFVLEALNDITREMLLGASESAYQLILKKAVECVPHAQAGSLLLRENSKFRFVAAVGFDLPHLTELTVSEEELSEWVHYAEYFVRKNPYELDREMLNHERLQILVEHGALKNIKSTLVVPVRIEGRVEILFNLDNFESEEAFTEEDVQIARLFANHVGILLRRLKLENQLKEQYKLIEHISYHDPLTGLANRRFLEESCEKLLLLAKRENKNVAVLFIDLVNYKDINDTYGHEVGDSALKVIAERLKKVVRSSDFVARFGGDEFILLLYDCNMNGALEMVKRLIETVEKPIVIDSVQLQIGATIGVAEYPKDGETLDKLIRKADAAMYLAKRKGISVATTNELSD